MELTSPQYVVVVVKEPQIQPFDGSRDLSMFLEELEDMWHQMSDLTDTAKSRRAWRLLAGPVQLEMRTQGLGPEAPYHCLMGALKETYGDRTPLSQLMIAFYSCSQQEDEGVREFTRRLHDCFLAVSAAQERDGLHPLEARQLTTRLIEGVRCSKMRQWLKWTRAIQPGVSFPDIRRQAISLELDCEPVGLNAVTAKIEVQPSAPIRPPPAPSPIPDSAPVPESSPIPVLSPVRDTSAPYPPPLMSLKVRPPPLMSLYLKPTPWSTATTEERRPNDPRPLMSRPRSPVRDKPRPYHPDDQPREVDRGLVQFDSRQDRPADDQREENPSQHDAAYVDVHRISKTTPLSERVRWQYRRQG